MSVCEENLFQIPYNKENKLKDEPVSYFPINFNELLTESQTIGDLTPSNLNQHFILKDPIKKEINSNQFLKENIQKEKSSSIREFKCEENGCDKVYRTKENLKLHILNIHLHLKPYECSYCSRRFSHRNGIFYLILGKTYHERKFHMNYLPYKCKIEDCYKNFANKSSLNYHLKFHHKIIKFLLKKCEQ